MKPKMECRTVDLPAPLGADQAEGLTFSNVQIEIVQDFHLSIASLEVFQSTEMNRHWPMAANAAGLGTPCDMRATSRVTASTEITVSKRHRCHTL